jgi:hypothetical protein
MNRLRELRQGAMFYEPLALESGPGEESGNGHD